MHQGSYQPGQTITGTGYIVESVIGSGAAGTVYKCTELALNRSVAVKVLNSWSESYPNLTAIKRMEREAKVLSRLIHKNIVRVYRIGFIEETVPFISMEYLDGISLREHLTEEQSLSPRRSLEIVKQAAEALAYAHDNGIVHRDLKPENIIIVSPDSRSPQIKIIDFGLSKAVSKSTTLTDPGDLIGTVLYMSPEQCLAKALDSRTDIYSLGCILYELLTGEPPFQGSSVEEVLSKHISEEAPGLLSSEKLLKDIQGIYQKCLQKKPELRYQNAMELKLDLEKVLSASVDFDFDSAKLAASIEKKEPVHSVSLRSAALGFLAVVFVAMLSCLSLPLLRFYCADFIAGCVSPGLSYELQRSQIQDLRRISKPEMISCVSFAVKNNRPDKLGFEQESEILGCYYELCAGVQKELAYEIALAQLKNVCKYLRQLNNCTDLIASKKAIIEVSIDRFYELGCSKSQWRKISSTIERFSSVFISDGRSYLWRLSQLRGDAMLGAFPGDSMHAEAASRHYLYAFQQAQISDSNGARLLEQKLRNLAKRYVLNKDLFKLSLARSMYFARGSKLESLKAEFPETLKLSENCAVSGAEQGQLQALRRFLKNPDRKELQGW